MKIWTWINLTEYQLLYIKSTSERVLFFYPYYVRLSYTFSLAESTDLVVVAVYLERTYHVRKLKSVSFVLSRHKNHRFTSRWGERLFFQFFQLNRYILNLFLIFLFRDGTVITFFLFTIIFYLFVQLLFSHVTDMNRYVWSLRLDRLESLSHNPFVQPKRIG